MTKKIRLLLFFILLILFLLIAPSTVLYSWGFRIDFETKKLTQTGGFYFKVWPKSVLIYFDGKTIKKTDFFFGAAYIDNLLPKKYEVEVQKEGYHTWRKTLEIKERQVTDAKNIVLLSQNPYFEVLSKNVDEFFTSPDQKKMILKEAAETKVSSPPSLSLRESLEAEGKEWSLKLLELDKNIKSHLAGKEDLATSSLPEFVDAFFGIEKKEVKEEGKEAEKEEGQLSIDQRKLAYFSNSEVWVLFLKDELGQPTKFSGERLLVARFSEKIGDVFWLTNHYLIFTTGDKIKAAEIDDRDGINIIDFAEFPEPEQIFFNQTDKKLYILSKGNLYSSEKLLP